MVLLFIDENNSISALVICYLYFPVFEVKPCAGRRRALSGTLAPYAVRQRWAPEL